ncbi:MAG: hypothetical protein J6A52_00585 [Bacilli bacterium]|nr:hypothetical protein [Bacilli bacterium]
MSNLLNNISSNSLLIVCIAMTIVALFLAIAVAIEVIGNYRRKRRVNVVLDDDYESEINIKKDENISYVEDDEELEKTKAKIELEKLKERLRKEEEEKKKLLEINLALANNKVDVVKEEVIEENTPVVVNVSSNEAISENNNVVSSQTTEVVEQTKENVEVKEVVNESVSSDVEVLEEDSRERVSLYEELEEENAIISYDELKKASSFGYTDEEMDNYVDEKDAIISIQELEKLYKESTVIEEPIKYDIKRVEDLPEISDEKKFQSTPFISPVYGVNVTEESLLLEQTANLEKLNEEIRKTNEFLKTLKELKKNLQ